MTKQTTKTNSTPAVENVLRAQSFEAIERAALAIEQGAHQLAEQLQLARGTRGDIPVTAVPVVAEAPAALDTKSKLYKDTDAALCDKPYTFRDLCAHLGVAAGEENSLKSVLVRLQRDGRPVVNLGNGSRAIWWIDEHNRIGAIAAGKSRTVSAKR